MCLFPLHHKEEQKLQGDWQRMRPDGIRSPPQASAALHHTLWSTLLLQPS